MKTALVSSMLALSAVSFSVTAEDFSWSDVTFQPRAYVGYADYSLESGTLTRISDTGRSAQTKLLFAGPEVSELNINGFIGGLGATVAVGNFFGDIYYQAIPSKTATSATQLSIPEEDAIAYFGDVDVKHYDWAISLGYAITDQWSIFAGYKAGKTESDQSFNENLVSPESPLVQTGSFSSSFEQDGPFLGASYSIPIGPGALTFKAAYAYLSGKYARDFNTTCLPPVCEVPVPALQQFNWKGDSNAFSLGVSWTQSITENLGFSLGANYHQYKFDTSGPQRFTATIGGQVVPAASGVLEGGSLTEDLFTLTASLAYRF